MFLLCVPFGARFWALRRAPLHGCFGKLAVLPAYSSIENELELGVLDGEKEIDAFLENMK